MQMSQKLCRVIGFSGKVSLSVIPFPSSFVRCLLKSRMRITEEKTVPGCIVKTSGMKRDSLAKRARNNECLNSCQDLARGSVAVVVVVVVVVVIVVGESEEETP